MLYGATARNTSHGLNSSNTLDHCATDYKQSFLRRSSLGMKHEDYGAALGFAVVVPGLAGGFAGCGAGFFAAAEAGLLELCDEVRLLP